MTINEQDVLLCTGVGKRTICLSTYVPLVYLAREHSLSLSQSEPLELLEMTQDVTARNVETAQPTSPMVDRSGSTNEHPVMQQVSNRVTLISCTSTTTPGRYIQSRSRSLRRERRLAGTSALA